MIKALLTGLVNEITVTSENQWIEHIGGRSKAHFSAQNTNESVTVMALDSIQLVKC